MPADRRRRPRPRSARRPGQRLAVRQLERDRHPPRRRLHRIGRAPAGSAQRPDRRQERRPPRDRLSWHGRPLSVRPAVRAGAMESRDRHCARPGAGEPRVCRRARRRDAGRHGIRLGWSASARGDWPRARRRFQPQGPVGILGPDRRTGRCARRDRHRRRIDPRSPRLADHRRRRYADRPHRPYRGWHPQGLSAGSA